MPHTLTAKEQSLGQIFGGDYVLTIPCYQRPYAWGKEQVQELLDDLLYALAKAPEQLSEAEPYFLGSIVLIKSATRPDATVVDGQQRLTTLTLLLSAIRGLLNDAAIQSDITSHIYEKGCIAKGTQARYRLSLRERDRDFFRQYVQHEDGLLALIKLTNQLPDAQARIRTNTQIFMASFAKLNPAELVRLGQFIITRCYLVVVATTNLVSAYQTFSVLDTRGLSLCATDILKNHVIGRITPDLRAIYSQKWEDQAANLGRDAFEELFRHIYMVFRKAKPRGNLLQALWIDSGIAEHPLTFIDETLLPMAQAFSEISNADYVSQTHADQVNKHLRCLNQLEFKDWVPPALIFLVRYRNQPESTVKFFGRLERLANSMLESKYGVNERVERFSALTTAIENGLESGASNHAINSAHLKD